MKIHIKKLNNEATIPTNGSKYAAGYDLYACFDTPNILIPSQQTRNIGTGVAVAIPEGYFGAVFARSGLSTKQGLRPANCVGVIDSDYRGEIMVPLYNDDVSMQKINNKDRIAQLVIMPYIPIEFEEVDELTQTDRGEGGFGSTGVNCEKQISFADKCF